jgi:hypothetical protein
MIRTLCASLVGCLAFFGNASAQTPWQDWYDTTGFCAHNPWAAYTSLAAACSANVVPPGIYFSCPYQQANGGWTSTGQNDVDTPNRRCVPHFCFQNGQPNPDCGLIEPFTPYHRGCQAGRLPDPNSQGCLPCQSGETMDPNTGACSCPVAGQQVSLTTGQCFVTAPYKEPLECVPSTPNPIIVATGNKVAREMDINPASGVAGLGFERYFSGLLRRAGGSQFSANWTHTFSHWLSAYGSLTEDVFRPNGQMYVATSPGAPTAPGLQQWTVDSDVVLQVYQKINASLQPSGWLVVPADGSLESYDTSGNLQSIEDKQGRSVTIAYASGFEGHLLDANWNATLSPVAPGLVVTATDSFGRSLSFGYNTSLQSPPDPMSPPQPGAD